jgi:type III secretory pathway component EscS
LQKQGAAFGITLTVITVVLTIGAIWYGLTR